MNILTLLEMAAEAQGDRTALQGAGGSLTYAELLAAARAAGRQMREAGAAYALLLDTNSPAAAVTLFGAAAAGIPYVPLNYRLTGPELEALAERAAPAFAVAGGEARLAPHPDRRIVARDAFLAALGAGAGDAAAAESDPQQVAVQLFTSGTTGRPKAALLRHENLVSYILGSVEFAGAAEDEAALVSVPPYHIAGIAAVLSATYAGRRLVLQENFDAADWLRLCREQNVTQAFVVPTMLVRIVEALEQGAPPPTALRALAYGGGRMPEAVIGRAVRLLPEVGFTNAYGLTETSSTIALLTPEDHRAAAASDDPAVRRRLGSVGRPLPSVEIEVRGEDGALCPVDTIGLVYVRGPQVAGEYAEAGSQLDTEGWFCTRDRGRLDREGYLFLDGRADDVIVRGGENISPGEVEEVLMAHPAVAEAAVVGIPSEQWGEAVAAAVVLRPGSQCSEAELQGRVRDSLRSSRVPERIRFVAQLPYNETGKLLRRVIRDEFAAS